jgi:hypothetical protein
VSDEIIADIRRRALLVTEHISASAEYRRAQETLFLLDRLAAVTAENADLRKKLDQNEAAYNEGYMIAHAPRRRIDVDGRDVTDEAGLWCETDHFIAADAAIRKDDINLSNCQKCGEFMGHGHVCPTPTKARTA